jgi:polyhydroxyalkanoate synthase
MTAGLHADFVDMALDNTLAEAGAITVLGVPIDLSRITTDAYIVAGIADHITPWQNCYRTTHLLGGTSRFVLSTSGHIAALVNPPGNPKSSFQVNKDNPTEPADWLRSAHTEQGTWWTDLSPWLADRCGALKPAPAELGGGGLRPLVAAPGTYVFDS